MAKIATWIIGGANCLTEENHLGAYVGWRIVKASLRSAFQLRHVPQLNPDGDAHVGPPPL